MQIAAPCGDFVLHFGNAVFDRHENFSLRA
jgi:hypothetical protein